MIPTPGRRAIGDPNPPSARSDALVFFGVTGDLAYKKIFPALQSLVRRGRLTVPVIGVAKVAPDHPWVVEHPEYFIQGKADDAKNDPASFVEVGGKVFACGRDPYFPAWPDVLQLNTFQPGLRQAVIETVYDHAGDEMRDPGLYVDLTPWNFHFFRLHPL